MLFGIPILSLIVPIVFMGAHFNRAPYFSWEKYISTFIIVTGLWFLNRWVLILCRRRYPLFTEIRKRILIQSIAMIGATIAGNWILHVIFCEAHLFSNSSKYFTRDEWVSSNSAAIFCVIMIMAIYESIYFIHALRDSIEEKEMLKRESLKAQLNSLRTQVNPHFLFNNLNTLSSLIPENPEHAVDFVQQLSKVYRHILEVEDEKSISLKDELEVLNAYTFLLKTRFGNNLQVNIDISDEKLQKKIVPLSLQILMENAIKHNIVSAEKPLHINITTENGSLVLSNNLQIKKQLNECTGIGLDNIRNRYKLLSDKLVKVTESDNNFTVSIPLIEN